MESHESGDCAAAGESGASGCEPGRTSGEVSGGTSRRDSEGARGRLRASAPAGKAPEPLESTDLPQGRWDVVIAGAGPAGATCALRLARLGHGVLLADRHAFPRDKACGDLLIPDSLEALRRSGLFERVRAAGRPLSEAVVSSPSRIEWTVTGQFVTLRREVLDTLLVTAATDAGTVLVRGAVEDVTEETSGRTRVTFRGGSAVDCRITILATGADVAVAERIGMVERKAPSAIAVRAYIRSPVGPERLLIAFDRSIVPGYGWIFPLPDGEFNVGVGRLYEERAGRRTDLRALLDHFLSSYPPARATLEAGDGLEAVRGARLRCGVRGTRLTSGGRVLAVGETVGTTYPFTGEGVGKAMESGELAAEAVHDALSSGKMERLRAYGRVMDETLRPRYRGYQAAQDWCSRPLLNDVVSWRVRRSPYLRRKAAEMVAETSDPREAVSIGGLMRSFWS